MTTLIQNPGHIRDLSAAMAKGEITAEALVRRYLDRIAAVDGQVKAWIHVLADAALAEARALDAERKAGKLRGPLHGIPVGIKDVIDVRGLPTRANSPSRADIAPASADATVVAHLRAGGAIVLGKLHTTEYAFFQSLPPTRNPWDLARTPGGSSAGSGAAIAAGMVPLALGTQTAGSVNRPAAYTGVCAFKPSTLAIGGVGVVPLAPSFDTVGAFGVSAQDAAYLAAGYAADHLRLVSRPATTPRIVLLQDPLIEKLQKPTTAARVAAGLTLHRASAGAGFEEMIARHRRVMLAELGRTHAGLPRDRISPHIADGITEGLAIPDEEYHAALRDLAGFRARFWAGFGSDDFILVPAAPDVAPDAGSTGDPSFVIPTTVLGGPGVTLRAGLATDTGLPVGALLFARPGADATMASFLFSATATALDL